MKLTKPPGLTPRRILLLAVTSLHCGALAASFQIGQNFTGSIYGVDSSALPADANGAVGPHHYVEFINGHFAVYDKQTGQQVKSLSDLEFWANSGVTISRGLGVTDPRLVFDPAAQRWFASMIDFNLQSPRQTSNRFLLAVSADPDPTSSWHGFAFTADPVNGDFADFPALGVDQAGVYLSGDLFAPRTGLNFGSTLVAFPKDALLASSPSIDGRVSFGVLGLGNYGLVQQPAMTTGTASTGASVLAIGNLGLDNRTHTTLFLTTLQGAQLALSNSTALTVPPYQIPTDPVQPNGSTNLDGGDTRFSASVRRVGDLLYAAHSTELNGRAAVRWYRVDAKAKALLESGTIADPDLNLFYPSIAANDSGTVVIACNGCSSTTFVSCYAAVGQTAGGTLTFGGLTLLKAGMASYQLADSTGTIRWGDYSCTTVDPMDPSRFWTIQTYAAGKTTWATQITELITGYRLAIARSGTNLVVTWPAAATNVQLQSSQTLLPAAVWAPVAQAPLVTGGVSQVLLPLSDSQSFFRLSQ